MLELSIIIPAYNEAKRIAAILKDLKRAKSIKAEIILVDDGSEDNTVKLAQKIIPKIKILSNSSNQGKGAALRKGVLAAQKKHILIMDADNSTPISELDKFIPYLNDYDILVGSRALDRSLVKIKQVFYKEWLGRWGNLLLRLLLVKGIKDTQCGFKLFSEKTKKIWRKQKIKGWGYDFEVLFLAQKDNLKIKEIAVIWRNHSESKVKFLDYPRALLDIFKIRINYLFKKYG